MRVIGEFDAGDIKVTVFKMNERISIKFEKNLLEQTYKFRDGSAVSTLQEAQTFCATETIDDINKIFDNMAAARSNSLNSMIENQEEKFDVII
jgi:hypothetical protein